MILTGTAVGIIFPLILFFSQTLSEERKGALAGLASISQFISAALVPTIYEVSFQAGGISMVYQSIFIVCLVFITILIIFGILAKNYIGGKR
jgi:fucose permease